MRKLRIEELNRINVEQFKNIAKIPLVIVLDNIRSHHNTGAVFRTADAFLIERLLLCGITGSPPHRDIYKTALGACESVEWKYYKSTLVAVKELKQNNYVLLALEQAEGSIPLSSFQAYPHLKYALIIGHEVRGVQQEVLDLCDMCLEIPQHGTKHSLNVSVSTSIAIWELTNKLSKA
ncbi:MAG TPA: RNA methyltransferase [Bacteroidales bacterium]|nr:RNA methyltransferase [Bacteroidales bacterium]